MSDTVDLLLPFSNATCDMGTPGIGVTLSHDRTQDTTTSANTPIDDDASPHAARRGDTATERQ